MTVFDVVGFGALNVDKLFRVNRIAAAEEESYIIDFQESCGGSAANTIIGLARLGCKVGFIGKVSKDREGRMLLEDFRREGVDTAGIMVTEDGRSGTVMGFVDEEGERALYVDPGVNDNIEFAEIEKKYVLETRFLHFTSFVGQKSFQTQKKLVEILPVTTKLSLDPGEFYARRMGSLQPIMNKAFVMMPNKKELQLLTGEADYRKGAQILLSKGVRIVAVKLGDEGCYVTDGEKSYQVEPFKVNAIDTTGAGDAFSAGFLYGLIFDKSIFECGRMGNFVASRSISRMGAREGLPQIKDLDEEMN
ncbi:MAG: carbohydrate kinase family protein [Candidatus Bathyarchaeota archaeon]|jgi:ribokinase